MGIKKKEQWMVIACPKCSSIHDEGCSFCDYKGEFRNKMAPPSRLKTGWGNL